LTRIVSIWAMGLKVAVRFNFVRMFAVDSILLRCLGAAVLRMLRDSKSMSLKGKLPYLSEAGRSNRVI